MTEPNEFPRQISPEQRDRLMSYDVGVNVLINEGQRIRASVDLLSRLSNQPADGAYLPAVASVATAEDTPTLQAVEILPLIQSAVEPFSPKQTDATGSLTQRYTMNWKAVGERISELFKTDPTIESDLTDWFLGTGGALIETTYSAPESRRPLHIVTGGANDQANHRSFLALASLASSDFRAEQGLDSQEGHSLKGEDTAAFGWLHDRDLQASVRDHVAQRVEAGEISPKILVIASAAQGRVLKPAERKVVTQYLGRNPSLLYPKRGITEADAMLAGALRTFGGDRDSMLIEEIPSADQDELPAKRISFESEIGRIEVLATLGSEANILSQVIKAHKNIPELFEGIDGLYGETTAIYTWGQRAILREAAARLGINDVPVEMLGLSAHAAGIERNLGTLIGELTMYLKAAYAVADRALTSAEHYTKNDVVLLGGRVAVDSF